MVYFQAPEYSRLITRVGTLPIKSSLPKVGQMVYAHPKLDEPGIVGTIGEGWDTNEKLRKGRLLVPVYINGDPTQEVPAFWDCLVTADDLSPI